jgi:hypothetical protein
LTIHDLTLTGRSLFVVRGEGIDGSPGQPETNKKSTGRFRQVLDL